MSVDEAMLTARLKACSFVPNLRQNDMTSRGGASQSVETGPPFWTASFRYENLRPSEYRALTAWIHRRNGTHIPFMGFLPSRRYPAGLPSADNAGLVLSSYNATTKAITINKAGMEVGDHVSWIAATGAQFIGEIVEIVTAGASTRFLTFPPAPSPHATPSPRIFEAYGRFRLMPNTYRPEDKYDGNYNISFEARQEEKAI
jgi:hypothetical protein